MTQKMYSWALFQRNEKLCLHKNLNTGIYSSFINNNKKSKITKVSFNE